MSSSTGEPCNKGIDGSVGGLVWVRRRNGSWWPGRIMGHDELPESCLVSPRSGTPVKLLGRKDASIDWYNLEKSKRVKAFRCGEYDDCIEKAKAAAATLSKKVVKYARREDAILHALELESSRLGKDHPDFYCRNYSSVRDGALATESPTISDSGRGSDEVSGDQSDGDTDSHSGLELSRSGISFEEPNHVCSSKLQSAQGRRKTPNDSEDDGTEGTKRMRGLEDLGMGVVSNKTVQVVAVVESVHQDISPGTSTVNFVPNGIPVNGCKNYSSSLKRKRSQVAIVHDFLKKKNRRRPLTKVLESTAMVSVPVTCDQLASSSGNCLGTASDCKASGLEQLDSKKTSPIVPTNSESPAVSHDNEPTVNDCKHAQKTNDCSKTKETSRLSGLHENELSDVLFDVPFVGVDRDSTGFPPMLARAQLSSLGRHSSQSSQIEAASLPCNHVNESGPNSLAAVHVDQVGQRIDKGTSKWQSKGKRNSRQLSKNRKRHPGRYLEMDEDTNTYLAGLHNPDGCLLGSDRKPGITCIDGSSTLHAKLKSGSEGQVDGVPDWGLRVFPGESHMKRQAELKPPPNGSPTSQRSLPHRQSRFTVHSRHKTDEYPIGDLYSNSPLYDVELEVKASYRPTHVPLVSLMSKLNGKAIVGHPLSVEVLDGGYCDNLVNTGSCDANNLSVWGGSDMGHLVNRSSGHVRRTAKSHSRKKPSKARKSGQLSKKMRKLSSLTGHKRGEDMGKFAVEKPAGPVIACIPLKVVFSRINEAVNGSVRPTHRALTSNN
ncbi:uncharacterized protein At1g51745 isoform X2 [Syzygium oleosum]|uniref:uncharacterized protein At1g51745 isoform X2 n=1 Tax=Syzygium oleosum TaxID=219896 RepID=UPI0011D1AAC0|nr:uncharacterized protein At1g51745 isoform X2 [Syzygium oleosum]